MKNIPLLLLAAQIALAQSDRKETGGIGGTVVDATTQKPIPAALVTASRSGARPFVRNTKTGADGVFQISGLIAGDYRVCVQTGDPYLNPCDWGGSPAGVSLVSGQAADRIRIAMTPASMLNIQVIDAQNVLSEMSKAGWVPDLSAGVWGPGGRYYPARAVSGMAGTAGVKASISGYRYQVVVPRDTTLKFSIASREVRLGDANGVALSSNASQQSFQHATGEAHPKSFTFTVLGKLP